MPVSQSPGPGGLRRSVSPVRAMVESSLRTLISMAVGGALTVALTWLAGKGISIEISDEAQLAIIGLVWSGITALYAAAQRKLWPIQTDAPGAARTDVTAGGKVV